jgi:hypothetical protein
MYLRKTYDEFDVEPTPTAAEKEPGTYRIVTRRVAIKPYHRKSPRNPAPSGRGGIGARPRGSNNLAALTVNAL